MSLAVLPMTAADQPVGRATKSPSPSTTFEFHKWQYKFTINAYGTRSQGEMGRLSYEEREQNLETIDELHVNDYLNTPWGPLYWHGKRKHAWDSDGWLSRPARNKPAGKRLSSPDARPHELQLSLADNGKTERVVAGDAVVIRLPSGGGRPPRWNFSTSGEAVSMQGQSECQRMVIPLGWGRYSHLFVHRLRAAKPGVADVTLKLLSESDGDAKPLAVYQVTLEVVPASEDEPAPSEPPQLTDVEAIAFAPDGKTLAAAGFTRSAADTREYQITTWDPKTKKRISSLHGHDKPVTTLRFSPDGTQLAGAADNQVYLWDVASGELKQTLKMSPGPVLALGYNPSCRELITLSGKLDEPTQVTWWDPKTGGEIDRINGPAASAWKAAIRFSSKGTRLAIVLDDVVRVFDARTRELQQSFVEGQGRFESADLSPDGKIVAVASNRKVAFFDASSGLPIREWSPTDQEMGLTQTMPWRIMSVMFSPDEKTLAIAFDLGKRLPSGMVIFRDMKTGKCLRTEEHVWERMTQFVFSPDGKQLAVGQGNRIYLFARDEGQTSVLPVAR
jgi:WD40 repeat protein